VKATTIANALVLEGWDDAPRPGAIRVEGDRIAAIAYGADAAALTARGGAVFDARGAVAMPALVNAHHHSYGNLLRGTENGLPLELWALFTVAWGRSLDAGLLRLAILVGAAEMLRAGVGSVIDHSPAIRLHAASIAAHRESGMRVGYAPMLHDRHDHDLLGFDLPAALRVEVEGAPFPPHDFYEATIAELVQTLSGDARLKLLLAPNAPQRCSPELLTLWGRLRDRHGLGVHAHLLETRAQAILCRKLWADGLVAELARRGLLAPGMAVAHGVWATAAERDLLAHHGVVVVHNPASNLMLGSGAMPFAGHRAAGVTLALGSDGANSGGTADPFELMRLAQMLPRLAQIVGADGAPFSPSSPEVLQDRD
jgi:5-methylthioadenosine/S-adenosylhomocysteine deaminase